tara:strand:+ start:101 stop:301 length:201 start_codon:yes stop_codon:yes gene_type:complete
MDGNLENAIAGRNQLGGFAKGGLDGLGESCRDPLVIARHAVLNRNRGLLALESAGAGAGDQVAFRL